MASYSFNLVDEKWIPCLTLDGRADELGLLETLVRAHEIREVFDPSPLVTASLHRLLFAILHRNFGPTSLADWTNLWNQGQWDKDKLSAYFSNWHHRFDLFDEERPFYQTCEIEGAEKHPALLLAIETSSGNNATLFDHNNDLAPVALSPAEAARYLIARQAYSIGFGKSSPFYFSDSPLIRGMMVMALGDTLFETTTLNLLAYNEDQPFPRMGQDLPAWEQEKQAKADPHGSPIMGYLDYLTWQSRSIHLFPEGDPTTIRLCQLQQNLKLPEQEYLDPFKCFRKDEKRGYVPLNISKDKALWRDSHVLFQTTDPAHKRPETCNWLALIENMRRNGKIQAKQAYTLFVIGLATDPGKAGSVTLWRHERMPLPLDYLADESIVEDLRYALNRAKEAGKALTNALRQFAIAVLPSTGNKVDWDAVRDLVEHLGADRLFWARLEKPFYQFLTDLPEDREGTLDTWVTTLRRTCWDCFEEATRDLDGSARTLRSIVEARQRLGSELKRVLA